MKALASSVSSILPKPAKRRAKQRWPFIKKRTYPNGAIGWQVDARTKNGGERKTFETLAEAETFADQCRIRRDNEGVGAFGNEELARYGKTVQDAISFYLAHLRREEQSAPIETAIAELIALRAAGGKSKRYALIGTLLALCASSFCVTVVVHSNPDKLCAIKGGRYFWGPRDAGEGLVNGRVWVAGGARRHRRLGADSG